MSRFPLYVIMVLGVGPAASAAAAQGTGPISVRLEPVGNSGISGTAELRPDGDDTEFALTLNSTDRARANDDFDVWLRAGTCAAPGRALEDVEDLEANGETETEDEDVRLADLLGSEHILEVRVEDREEVVACGAIRR